MSPVTHALLPLVFGHRWIPKNNEVPSFRVSGLIALAGVLPDILSPHLSLDARHSSLSHSVTGLCVFTLLVAAIGVTRFGSSHRFVGVICVFGYAAHILCDLIAGGVGLLLPFSRSVYGRNFIPYWAWDAADIVLIIYVYLAYRWLPLRRRYASKQSKGGLAR